MIMKKILKLSLFSFLALGMFSCVDDDNDTLTGDKNVGGLLSVETLAITYAQGSAPTDALSASLSVFQGREKVETVDVYKQYFRLDGSTLLKSNNVLLKSVNFPVENQHESLTFSFNYNELISGVVFEGQPLPADDATLEIGDYWLLTYVAKLTDGRTEHLNVKSTKVNVSCGSFLAGNYSNRTVRTETGTVYTFANDLVTPIADGLYVSSYIGPYYCAGQAPGSANTIQLPAGTRAGYTFSDVCNVIGLDTQNLASAFTNEVRQSAAQKALSNVNPVTGVITVHYSIFFTGNTVERPFVTTLTPL